MQRNREHKHFLFFAKLLKNHLAGILSHAEFRISNGKVEGINQKIKTIRRASYALPDDEYFFLKLFDLSRHTAYSGQPQIFRIAPPQKNTHLVKKNNQKKM